MIAEIIVKSLILIYTIGYFACIFSWLFSEEALGYIKRGEVTITQITKTSFNWPYILYITIMNSIYNDQ